MSRGRVLVVDDNELNRELLEQELEDEGFEVLSAEDGPEAIELLRREAIDLVLLDIQMPKMSGLEVLERVRRDHPVNELPIIMATAKAASRDVVEALELGATDYVTKPIDFPVLLARINTHLKVRDRATISTTGAYQRLKGEDKTRFREVSNYCTWCLTAHDGAGASCPECEAPKPGEWPEISREKYAELGRIHGNYFFDKMLGAGWGGVVYRARSLDLDRAFAAKVAQLAKGTSLAPEAVRNLVVAEVEALAKLRNPHVVQIFEVVHLRADVYALIMEFVEGTTLRKLVDEGPLRPADALSICRQVAIGLSEVHRHNMVHCDLKPENIIVEQLASGEYFAKVLDFGIVKSSGAVSPDGAFIGTPKYASPESFDEAVKIDARSDVYSLGVLLYRLLTSVPPFSGASFEDLLRAHLSEPVPQLSASGTNHPDFPVFDRFIQRAMSKDPERRPGSMTEVIELLDELRDQSTRPGEAAELPDIVLLEVDVTMLDD